MRPDHAREFLAADHAILCTGHRRDRPRSISPGGPEQGYNIASFEGRAVGVKTSANKRHERIGKGVANRCRPADRSPGERQIRPPDPARCPLPLLFRHWS